MFILYHFIRHVGWNPVEFRRFLLGIFIFVWRIDNSIAKLKLFFLTPQWQIKDPTHKVKSWIYIFHNIVVNLSTVTIDTMFSSNKKIFCFKKNIRLWLFLMEEKSKFFLENLCWVKKEMSRHTLCLVTWVIYLSCWACMATHMSSMSHLNNFIAHFVTKTRKKIFVKSFFNC